MRTIRFKESVISAEQLGPDAARLLRKLATTGAPLVVTQNGKPAAVLLSTKTFDELMECASLLVGVGEVIEDAPPGQAHSPAVKNKIRAQFRGKSK